MSLSHFHIPWITACLVLPFTTTAQTDMIQPVSSTTTTLTLDVLLSAIPAISNASNIEVEIPSVTIAAETSPTPVLGDDTFILIGCFNEPPAISSTRALGATGSYLTPTFATQDSLTVPLCLDTCGVALAPNTSGPYIYAAVENSRECYCGLTLSPLSKSAPDGYCSSPCASDLTTICGGYGYLSLYQRRSSLNGTNTTSTKLPTFSPIATVRPSKGKSRRSPGFWVGISLGIFFFLVLVLALIFYIRRRQLARRARALSNAGLSTDTSFLGGFALMHPSQRRQRPPVNAVYTEDGRRFGIVVDDAGTDVGTYVSPMDGSPHPGIRNRPTFEEWKSGVVSPAPTHVTAPAPARVPASPSAITHSVELDSIVNPGGHSDSGAVAGGGKGGGHHTPIAELADSRLPVSVDSKERRSSDVDGIADMRPGLDERELERRLKELGGLSPVSEVSGAESRVGEVEPKSKT